MRNLLRYILCLVLLSLAACHEGGAGVDDEQISVTLKLGTGAATRGVTDSPSDTSSWSQAERAVDGRYIYTLSVYIVDAKKNIVASKENITVDNQATEVVVKFDKSPDLKRGVHTLMAVANNSNHTIGNTTLNSGLTAALAAGSYDALMNNKISSGDDYVSPKDVVQPLSLMKEFEIHAGENFVEGELTRTFARLRIEVKNNSGSLPLKINNLTFSSNFAQKESYVFDDGSDKKYSSQTGAIVATSDGALQPFMRDNNENYKTIPAQSSAVVYDGYQLESKATTENGFTYTLDMSYEGTSSSYDVFSVSDTDTAISNISKISSGSYYLIYNPANDRYLSASDNLVTASELKNFNNIRTSNIWQVIQSGNYYYFKNVETGKYMQAPTDSSISLGEYDQSFTLYNDSNGGINIYTSKTWRYIGVNENSAKGFQQASNPTRFNFYKVTKTTTKDINKEIDITLTSIDPVSQQSSKVTAIKRNDFINVLVTVSYNPTSGEFDFRVEDWDTGGGQVEFN